MIAIYFPNTVNTLLITFSLVLSQKDRVKEKKNTYLEILTQYIAKHTTLPTENSWLKAWVNQSITPEFDSNKNPAGRWRVSEWHLKFLTELIYYCSLNKLTNQSIPCLNLDPDERKWWTWSYKQSMFEKKETSVTAAQQYKSTFSDCV